jgi:hypothetical protein
VAIDTSAAARERAFFATADGASAAPGGLCCVESARRAELETTKAGLDPPGVELSKFGERRPPAVPASALASARREGSAVFSRVLEADCTEVDCSTATWEFVDEIVFVARRPDRAGLVGSSALTVGEEFSCAAWDRFAISGAGAVEFDFAITSMVL